MCNIWVSRLQYRRWPSARICPWALRYTTADYWPPCIKEAVDVSEDTAWVYCRMSVNSACCCTIYIGVLQLNVFRHISAPELSTYLAPSFSWERFETDIALQWTKCTESKHSYSFSVHSLEQAFPFRFYEWKVNIHFSFHTRALYITCGPMSSLIWSP
jgi:hypothetical protein